MEKKKCTKCDKIKNSTEFHKCSCNKDGLQSQCKLCRKKYYSKNSESISLRAKQYRKVNREKISERVKKYYRNNWDKINIRHKKYYRDNKEKFIEYDKEYYQNNKERIIKRTKIYTEKNKDKLAQLSKQRYENNKEKIFKQRKQYYNNNKELLDARRQEYRISNAKYKLFFDKLTIDESPKLNDDGISLEVLCRYCGKYFVPSQSDVQKRVNTLNGDAGGDQYLYCSENCKDACPIFNQKLYPRSFKKASSREVDSLIRYMCFKRDNWECQICGESIKEVQLHCHHIEGYTQNPGLGNDIDNVVTLCKECHKEVHKLPGCNYYDLRCKAKGEE